MTTAKATWNFFLMFDGNDVRRLALTADVQSRLSDFFEEATKSFMKADVVHFGGAEAADHEELLEIPNFALPEPLLTAAKAPITATLVGRADLEKRRPKGIVGTIQQGGKLRHSFQVLDRRQVLSTNTWTIMLSGETFRRMEEPGLTVGDHLTAIFVDGSLRFTSYFQARRLFDLSQYYRMASEPDVVKFTKHAALHFDDPDAFREAADEWTRRRIALIQDSKVLSHTPKKIQKVAADFDIQLNLKNGKVIIPAEKKAFKGVIRLLSDDLLQSPLTEDRFLATSKRKLPNKE